MSNSSFKKAKIRGIKTVVPEKYIDIDDEIQYFENNPKKLARTKNIVGYGRRHVLEEGCTVVDMCEVAANNLIEEMGLDKSQIDTLVVVNQSPDYLHPSSAAILHGRLGLEKSCATLDLALGCSGYVYGLWTCSALIESGAAKKVLLLAGDAPSTHSERNNRLTSPIFGDAGSATFIEYSEDAEPSYFSLGTDGKGWDRIISPASASRLPLRSDICDKEIVDGLGNVWKLDQGIIHGQDVFNFTIDVVPQNIADVLAFSGMGVDDIDFVSIHQANKQIVESIAAKAGLSADKFTSETFSRYGNNSTTSVTTVVCDALKDRDVSKLMLCGFGVGLSWASAIVGFKGVYNGGIGFYKKPADMPSRQEQIDHWIKQFKGQTL